MTAAGAGEVTFYAGTAPVPPARVTVGPTDGPYAHALAGAPCHVRGVTDLRVELRGPVRLAHVGFSG
ncbi:hypothetical protein ACI2LJ_16750 [Streptomyces sp. NPDC088090]|uniref:hypothetical protein n=1 Tax=Streptomyces sp. NPDC088090 TaxID=3365822 RepID=UPI00384FF17D